MFTDHDITPSFERKVSQMCNLPTPMPACPQLPKPENRVCFVCLHQASSLWDTHTYGIFPS